VKFSEPVINADASTIKLREKGSPNDLPIDIFERLGADGMVVLIIPRRNLKYSQAIAPKEYEISISADIQDIDGQILGQEEIVAFSTFAPKPSTPFELVDPKDEVRMGDTLYITDGGDNGNPKFRIVDVSDADNPKLLATAGIGATHVHGVDVSDDYYFSSANTNVIAAVAAFTGGLTSLGSLQVFDVTNPRDPKHIRGTILTSGALGGVPFRVKILGRYALVATLFQGIMIVDLEHAIDPDRELGESSVISVFGTVDHPRAIDMVGGKVYLLTETSLTILDTSLFPALAIERRIHLPNGGWRMKILPNFAFKDSVGNSYTQDLAIISTGSGKVEIHNVSSNPSATIPPLPVTFNLGVGPTGNLAVNEAMGVLLVERRFEVALLDLKRPLDPADPNDPDKPLVLATIENGGISSHTTNIAQTHFLALVDSQGGKLLRVRNCSSDLDNLSVSILGEEPILVGVDQEFEIEAEGCPKGGDFKWSIDDPTKLEPTSGFTTNPFTVKGIAPGTTKVHVTYTVAGRTRSDEVEVTVIEVILKEVSFIGDHSILKDGIGKADPIVDPVWVDDDNDGDPEINNPVAYSRAMPMQIVATFEITPSLNENVLAGVTIEGDGPGSLDFNATDITLTGTEVSIPLTLSEEFLPNETKYFNPMTIDWKSSFDGTNFTPAGTSKHQVYVTLADPLTPPQQLFLTALHLAISNDGAQNEIQAVQKTWDLIKGPANITTWDGRKLFYYKPGQNFEACATSSFQLLTFATGSGQCGSFALLLMDAFGANGIQSEFVVVRAKDFLSGTSFLVNDWGFGAESFPENAEYKWKLILSEGGGGMVPPLPADVYGDMLSLPGIPGQNTVTPSEKAFGSHFIVKVLGSYYDPSYGVTYVDADDFEEKSVAGYFNRFPGAAFNEYQVRKSTGLSNISFDK